MEPNASFLCGPKLSDDPAVPSSLQAILHNAARNHSRNGVCYLLSDGTEVFQSYDALAQAALRMLRGLQRGGVKARHKLIIQIEEPAAFFAAFWACVLGGIIPVPIAKPTSFEFESYGFERMKNVWLLLDGPVVLIDAKNSSDYLLASKNIRVLAYQQISDEVTDGCCERLCETDTALLQFSSGSTGQPKGVVLSHENLVRNIAAIIQAMRVEPVECSCSWLPHTHDMGLIGMHMSAVCVGSSQIKMTPELFLRRPSLYLSAISRHRVRVTASTNFGLAWLVERVNLSQIPGLDLSCIRILLNGAEPISGKVMREFCEKFDPCGFRRAAMCPVYGLAEASLAVTFSPIPSPAPVTHLASRTALAERLRLELHRESDDKALELVDVGCPVAGVDLRIVDDHDVVVPEGTVGHIQICGANVTSGYYRVDSSDGLFCDGWLRTNDMGFVWRGRLTISGRLKDMIIVRGQNWFAHDIEEVLFRQSRIRRGTVAVSSTAMRSNGEEQILVFVTHRGEIDEFVPTANSVRAIIAKELQLEVGAVVPIAKIPRTTSGKIRRFWLAQEFNRGRFEDVLQALAESTQRQSAGCIRAFEHPRSDLERRVRRIWSNVLRREPSQIDVTLPFRELGGTSVKAMEVLSELEKLCDRELSHDVLIKCQSIREIAAHLESSENSASVPNSLLLDVDSDPSRDIAIIGMACRFPKARDVATLWENLRTGASLVRPVSDKRKLLSGETGWIGYLAEVDDIDRFDAPFFGMPEAEAAFVDPQQKLALEVAYEVVEDCGLGGAIGERLSVGVFIGASQNSYQETLWRYLERRSADARVPSTLLVDNLVNMIAARLSQFFNWSGPALTIDSACSSSLVAVKHAVDSLRCDEVRYALAGGVNLLASPSAHRLAMQAGILSHTNRCKVFDIDADGTVLGEGVGAVMLCRLSTAIKERRHIYAVIKGGGVNNDGQSLGVMAPNPEGQMAVLAKAYADAGVDVATVGYVEAHGTGTPVGDPVEIKTLTGFLKQSSASEHQCGVGSVKSNLGHLLAASGIAGLIKTVLSLKHQTLVPTANLEQTNPLFDVQGAPYYLVRDTMMWSVPVGTRRRAGVSSFGFGGTNCHIVLEEAPAMPTDEAESAIRAERRQYLLPLSAKRPEALSAIALNLVEQLQHGSIAELADVAHTLQLGRQPLSCREFVVAQDIPDAVSQLEHVVGRFGSARAKAAPSGVVFLFPGQGTQYVNMGRELHELEPTFRTEFDDCCRYLQPSLGLDLRELIFPSEAGQDSAKDLLNHTRYAQPALFAVEWALAQLLKSWGVTPSCVIGHSLGEYVAATLAGVFSREDALELVAERGRLMQEAAPGCMLSVSLSEGQLEPFLRAHPNVSLAAVNSPRNCVIAGLPGAINSAESDLLVRGVSLRRLNVSHAFHTASSTEASEAFGAMLRVKPKHKPKIVMVSTATGQILSESEAVSCEYWQQQIVRPVRFSDAVACMFDLPNLSWLEVGSGSTLSALVRHHQNQRSGTPVTNILPLVEHGCSEHESLLRAVGKLWQANHQIVWSKLQPGGRFISLPTYPFEDRRYWISHQPVDSSLEGEAEVILSSALAEPRPAEETHPQQIAPRSEMEARIIHILEEVLEQRPIGVRQNFFELGGDSLAATRAIARLQSELNCDLPMNLIFRHQTPEGLGAALEGLLLQQGAEKSA